MVTKLTNRPYNIFCDKSSGSGFNLFDTKLSDHILEGEEAFGWALQGTYTLSSYTDFYQKCLEEKNAGVETQTTLGENTITTYNNPNGLIFFNIADKAVVDEFYNANGACWMYGIDEENQRIFLPRNDRFEQASSSSPGEFVEAGLPNIKGELTNIPSMLAVPFDITNGALKWKSLAKNLSSRAGNSDYGSELFLDASLSDPIFGNSDTVQPASVKKLLYICVGNTVVNQADVDVQKLTGDIQNLESLKADKTEIVNIVTATTKSEDLTVGASGTSYIAPAAGYFAMSALKPNTGQVILICKKKNIGASRYVTTNNSFVITTPLLDKGDEVKLVYDGTITTPDSSIGAYFKFVYAGN